MSGPIGEYWPCDEIDCLGGCGVCGDMGGVCGACGGVGHVAEQHNCVHTCLELFAGCGGAALGIEAAGVKHLGLVEKDPAACRTMRAAGLGPVIEADVRDLEAIAQHVSAPIDLVWSSWPCQPFSKGGLRRGALDERNGWPWTMAALEEIRPRYFVGENVRGIVSHLKNGCGDPDTCPGCYTERQILPDLRKLFQFVDVWLLDAADFGLPQRRRRVFFVGSDKPLTPPTPTHSKTGGMFAQKWVSMASALGFDDSKVAIGGGTNPKKGSPEKRTYRILSDEPSTTISAKSIPAENQGPWIMPADLLGPSLSVNATEYKGYTGRGNRASDSLKKLDRNRWRLTVEECAILQGFPKDYPFQGGLHERYRQVGNAVPPAMAEQIIRAIFK